MGMWIAGRGTPCLLRSGTYVCLFPSFSTITSLIVRPIHLSKWPFDLRSSQKIQLIALFDRRYYYLQSISQPRSLKKSLSRFQALLLNLA